MATDIPDVPEEGGPEDTLNPSESTDSDELRNDDGDIVVDPPEGWSEANKFGVTPREEREGESLDQRLAEEVPDLPVPDGDGIGDIDGTDGELLDNEVGARRSGRLVAPDEGAHEDEESALIATDVGIDGAAASAEEAAMHIVDEDAEDALSG